MKRHLMRRCTSCYRYTLKPNCPLCGLSTANPHPPKYSPDDKYVRYRIADRYSQRAQDGVAEVNAAT